MIRLIFISLFVLFYFTDTGMATTSAIVERHIFSPEIDDEKDKKTKDKKSLDVLVEKELAFTGIIKSSKSNFAMISDKKKKKKSDGKIELYKIGETVNGYEIKEIGNNYVVLTYEGEEVKMSLFRDNKARPAPPPEPKQEPAEKDTGEEVKEGEDSQKTDQNQDVQSDEQPSSDETDKTSESSANSNGKNADSKSEEKKEPQNKPNQNPVNNLPQPKENPFDTLKRQVERNNELKKQGVIVNPDNGGNPFLEAIRRAQQNRTQ